MLGILATLSGWLSLADNYRAEQFSGKKRYFQSLSMGYIEVFPVGHGGMITLGVNDVGVYFSVGFLFRLFHPPFIIPFDELDAFVVDRFFFKGVNLRTKKNPNVSIKITKGMANWIAQNSNGQWVFETTTNIE